jgi:hypothetical protein
MIPRRAWIYACAVVALTVAVLTQSGADSLIVQPVARNPRPPSGAAATSTGSAPPRSGGQAGTAEVAEQLLALLPREKFVDRLDERAFAPMFSARSWAPVQVMDSKPTKPAPPPLPFTYVGKQRVGDAWQVFIADKEELRIVKVADVIAQQYKVLAINPPTMTLDYLPLHEVQQLRLE